MNNLNKITQFFKSFWAWWIKITG